MGRPCWFGSRIIAAMFVATFALFGCGVKSSPVPPGAVTPKAVTDLSAQLFGDQAKLVWSLPDRPEGPEGLDVSRNEIYGFRVFQHKTPVGSEPCSGCPIQFERFFDVKMSSMLATERDAGSGSNPCVWYDPVEPGYEYFYKIIVLHRTGGMSNDSNVVMFSINPLN